MKPLLPRLASSARHAAHIAFLATLESNSAALLPSLRTVWALVDSCCSFISNFAFTSALERPGSGGDTLRRQSPPVQSKLHLIPQVRCRSPSDMPSDDASSAPDQPLIATDEAALAEKKRSRDAGGLRENHSFLIPVPSHNTLHVPSSEDTPSEVEVRPCQQRGHCHCPHAHTWRMQSCLRAARPSRDIALPVPPTYSVLVTQLGHRNSRCRNRSCRKRVPSHALTMSRWA